MTPPRSSVCREAAVLVFLPAAARAARVAADAPAPPGHEGKQRPCVLVKEVTQQRVQGGVAALLAGWGLTFETWWLFTAWLGVANPWLEQRFWRGLLGSPSIWPRATDGWFAGYHLLVIVTAVAWYWLPVIPVPLNVSTTKRLSRHRSTRAGSRCSYELVARAIA